MLSSTGSVRGKVYSRDTILLKFGLKIVLLV